MKMLFPYPSIPLFHGVTPPGGWRQRLLGVLGAVVLLGAASTNNTAHAQTPGALDPSFNASTVNNGSPGEVNTLSLQPDGKILLGGAFTQINGAAHANVARLNADGSVDAGFNASTDSAVGAVAAQPDGRIIVGGGFAQVNGGSRSGLARLNADGTMDASFVGSALGSVYSAAVQPDGKVVLGGIFALVNGVGRSGVVRLNADGNLDSGFNTRTNGSGSVLAVALQPDGKILLGGDFAQVNGAALANLARLNAGGSVDTAFNVSVSGPVSTLVVQPDGKIVLGGSFAQVNGVARSNVARLNADGTLDAAFNVIADEAIRAVSLQADGKLVLGGDFAQINAVPRGGLARLNADGSLDTGFDATILAGNNGGVRAELVQPNGRIVLGGNFVQVNGVAEGGIARLTGGAGAPPVGPVVVSVVGTPSRGGFVVSRSGSVDAPVTVLFHNGGSAIRDGDYVAFSGSITLAAGQSEAVIAVTLLPGANRNHKVKVFLDPAPDGSSYGIAKTQSKVFLSDLP